MKAEEIYERIIRQNYADSSTIDSAIFYLAMIHLFENQDISEAKNLLDRIRESVSDIYPATQIIETLEYLDSKCNVERFNIRHTPGGVRYSGNSDLSKNGISASCELTIDSFVDNSSAPLPLPIGNGYRLGSLSFSTEIRNIQAEDDFIRYYN